MRKEVESTEEAYFCDVCGEEICDTHWAYGGCASAYEETRQCFVCHRDTCPKCRTYEITFKESLDTFHKSQDICKPCHELNNDRITQIEQIKKDYYSEKQKLQRKYLGREKALGEFFATPKDKE